MKRYIRSASGVYSKRYILPEDIAHQFEHYLDNTSRFKDFDYNITITPEGKYQFDCEITFDIEFGINTKLSQLGGKKVRINDKITEVV